MKPSGSCGITRDVERVREDVRSGLVSPEAAARDCGVTIPVEPRFPQ